MLVLFLDDIQWADEPSLTIIDGLLTSTEVHLFTVAGCR
jgi:predicted ATPase